MRHLRLRAAKKRQRPKVGHAASQIYESQGPVIGHPASGTDAHIKRRWGGYPGLRGTFLGGDNRNFERSVLPRRGKSYMASVRGRKPRTECYQIGNTSRTAPRSRYLEDVRGSTCNLSPIEDPVTVYPTRGDQFACSIGQLGRRPRLQIELPQMVGSIEIGVVDDAAAMVAHSRRS